jgi:hypothetical protein
LRLAESQKCDEAQTDLTLRFSPSVTLELTNAGFVGSIPTELGQLSNLKLLFLSQNTRLTGTIPAEIARLELLGEYTLLFGGERS